MWWGCQGVSPRRSAMTGTASSAATSTRNATVTTDGRQNQQGQPEDLDDRDADRVRLAGASARTGVPGGAQPLGDHRDPHHDVGQDHHREVVIDERGFDAGREHQDTGHLHDGEDPVEPVVGGEGGGEPGEVHPGPPDGEEHHRVAQHALGHVCLGEGVVQLDGGDADRHHEHEIEEELQRGGRPAGLVRIPGSHRRQSVARRSGGRGGHHRFPSWAEWPGALPTDVGRMMQHRGPVVSSRSQGDAGSR